MKTIKLLFAVLIIAQLSNSPAIAENKQGDSRQGEAVAYIIRELGELRSHALTMAYQADQSANEIQKKLDDGTLTDEQLNEIYDRFFGDSSK